MRQIYRKVGFFFFSHSQSTHTGDAKKITKVASPRLDGLDETHKFEILKLNTVIEQYCKDQLSSMESGVQG